MTMLNLRNLIKPNKTLLGVGPMSVNCVKAATRLSNKFRFPIMLIASRRQIDSKENGGGYVNKWNTENYSTYVNSIDKKNKIILARDHGGPWQNNIEITKKYNLKQAMDSSKKSFEVDILNNFKIIHIDTSIGINNKPVSLNDSLERFYELFEHCNIFAKKNKKKVFFEIGTEEQSGTTNTPEELNYTLHKIFSFCKKKKLDKPIFVVIQSGTKVAETRNIGSFESPLRIENELPVEIQLPKMIEICTKNKIFMKEHNADYLSNHSLSLHPRLGIHATNVAPEFGVEETKALIQILKEYRQTRFLEDFYEISYSSKKWKKWLVKDSKCNKIDKAVIAGHYVFSSEKFKILKNKIEKFLYKKNLNLDNYLQKRIEKSIMRYAKNFNLVK
tara:strand:+ start:38 stop:1201 length:1164 start_codon:yes stop_codon:yes gene_type:complete